MKDIIFTAEHDGKLLECVRERLKDIPAGKSKSWLEHRLISVDGVVSSRFDFPVKAGQTLRIGASGKGVCHCPLEILYEDEALFAVNKPAGLLTVASDSEKEKTAYRAVHDSGVEPLFVVHRLDKDTSGVLLFARSAEMRDALQESWDEKVGREYIAVCEGVFEEKSGRIETFLRETSTHMMYSAPSGIRAVTNYVVTAENAKYSLLRVNLETGRKNQIRTHMKELGHPVAGDKKYGAKTDPLKRLALHARALTITHPVTGLPLRIEAPTPKLLHLPKLNREK